MRAEMSYLDFPPAACAGCVKARNERDFTLAKYTGSLHLAIWSTGRNKMRGQVFPCPILPRVDVSESHFDRRQASRLDRVAGAPRQRSSTEIVTGNLFLDLGHARRLRDGSVSQSERLPPARMRLMRGATSCHNVRMYARNVLPGKTTCCAGT